MAACRIFIHRPPSFGLRIRPGGVGLRVDDKIRDRQDGNPPTMGAGLESANLVAMVLVGMAGFFVHIFPHKSLIRYTVILKSIERRCLLERRHQLRPAPDLDKANAARASILGDSPTPITWRLPSWRTGPTQIQTAFKCQSGG